MTKLRVLGYWRSDAHPEYPYPRSPVDAGWDEDEREIVSRYLGNGTIARAYMGLSPCRICGENNGALEYTDNVFIWPSGLGHYVSVHNVRLPQPFVDHAGVPGGYFARSAGVRRRVRRGDRARQR